MNVNVNVHVQDAQQVEESDLGRIQFAISVAIDQLGYIFTDAFSAESDPLPNFPMRSRIICFRHKD